MMFIYGESSNDIHHPRTEKRPEHRDGSHKSRRCCRQSACAAAVRVERSRHGLSGSSVWSFGLRSSLIVCPRVSVALPSPTDQRPPSAVFLFGISTFYFSIEIPRIEAKLSVESRVGRRFW